MSDDMIVPDAGDELPQSMPAGAQPVLPGAILASRREEFKWSIEDVAHSLHMAPRQILALESDNYDALPGRAISRGFLRSYAKLLKLDPAPLLQMISNEADAKVANVALRRPLPAKPFYADRSLSLGAKPRAWMRSAIWILLGTALLLAIAWNAKLLPGEWATELKNSISLVEFSSDSAAVQPNEMKTVPAPDAPRSSFDLAPSAAQLSGAQSDSTQSVPALASPAAQGAPEAPATATKVPESTHSRNADSADLLVLNIREDSWIEVRDARNNVVLSRLAKSGESESIPVREPLKLKIGNAAGVDAKLRGVPVELSGSAKNNVARLTVN